MPAASTAPAPVETLSFESALAELETIVREMEAGKTGLEDSIKAYERGVALKNHCAARLNDAQMRIAQITQNADGTLGTKPLPSDTPQ